MSNKKLCTYDYGQISWGGPHHNLCNKLVIGDSDYCEEHYPRSKEDLIAEIQSLRASVQIPKESKERF